MCKRNSPDKNEASKGCVREIPQIKMKPASDVEEKLPRLKIKIKETKTIETNKNQKVAWDV